jgi:DNA polymerase elongation subunit (family B)
MDVRLFDFRTINRDDESENGDSKQFIIQMFGITEKRETVYVEVTDFKPYFFCLVPHNYTKSDRLGFLEHLKSVVGPYYAESILQCVLVRRKKLNGFDGCSEHNFICLKFKGMPSFYKVRNLWYTEDKKDPLRKRLKPGGYSFKGQIYKLYEADLPPVLRFLHIKEISPTGWVHIPVPENKLNTTTCTYEFSITSKDIEPLPLKETIVPYTICSFDIEASSSHGDFPVPIKDYKKLAENIVDIRRQSTISKDQLIHYLQCAFGYGEHPMIDKVYPKHPITKEDVVTRALSHLHSVIVVDVVEEVVDKEELEPIFNTHMTYEEDSSSEEEEEQYGETTILGILEKDVPSTSMIKQWLNSYFPKLEGDKVTFIGSSFITYGKQDTLLNHCIVLGSCDPVENAEIECYATERDVLLAWTRLIKEKDPDMLIGYNIFGFDQKFMFERSQETGCAYEFLELNRTKDTIAGKVENGKLQIEKKTVMLASGEYNLEYFNMPGRLQFDLHNILRRDYSFDSYKLDAVSTFFIGDKVTRLEQQEDTTLVYTKNLQGLELQNYVIFEEISHSSDYYQNGKKFMVTHIADDHFVVASVFPDMTKQVKWGLAKDDVDHHDIFRLTNGSSADRAIVAKYCIQDCRLVNHIFRKTDMLSGFIEMASICSVPMAYLTERGQGIKLFSYMAKQCRQRNMLMPVLQTPDFDTGYEGAIVIKPKCDIYTEDPIEVNDFNSLYPSCMISEGLSSDAKVWAKEYDLDGNLVKQEGCCLQGVFVYDNLPNYTYIDIEYDLYSYKRLTPKGKAVKYISGKRVVRWAQFQEGKAIMPSILEELLKARSDTRKKIAVEKDPFIKKMYDNRQLAYKVTANSLYGQCGAKTSKFYDKDVAACCTATGRKLLILAKNTIEEVYCNRECETSMGNVLVNAECIYGDTDSVFIKFAIIKDGVQLKKRDALEISRELGIEAGNLISDCLKRPHCLAYEKVLYPFLLFAKKKYVGMLYEDDMNKGYRKSMGIVLKRRDNAPIVKDVYGGLIDMLMKQGSIHDAIQFVKDKMKQLVQKKIPIEKLIITKSLRSGYKNPKQISHKVLADRMGVRDPGNKPRPGDRIRFVYIQIPKKVGQLQGERIETPEYIHSHNIPIDFGFYITNQLMKPLSQVFELMLEKIPGFDKVAYETELAKHMALPPEKYDKKKETIRLKAVSKLIFAEFI